VQILKKSSPILLSVLTGLFLTLSFPRFDFEVLAWFGFVPLFFAIESRTNNQAFWLGFLAGIVFYGIGLHWIINTLVNYGNISPFLGYPILFLLTAYLSCFIGLFAWVISKLCDKDPKNILLAPLFWTSFEYLRSTHSELGFSWLGLGYSQFLNLPMIQMVEFTGVYGVSALILLINSSIYIILREWGFLKKSSKFFFSKNYLIASTIFSSILFLGNWGYGLLSLNNIANTKNNRVEAALIQGNIEQKQKWDKTYRKNILDTYERLTIAAAKNNPDIIIWPEASLPFIYKYEAPETIRLNQFVKSVNIPMLIGAQYLEKNELGKYTYYNSAYFLKPGSLDNVQRYDKIHLVPFGEFVPFSNILSFVKKFVSVPGELGRGKKISFFELSSWKFGVSICYEITFPDLVRQSAKKGAQFLVTITNDAWFGHSAASYQHIAIAALRAVENRMPILRAANTGISGMIDSSGKIHDQTKIFVEGTMQTTIEPRVTKPTYYSQNGDIFSLVLIIFSIIFGILTCRNKTRNIS
jgi:apolipoprotein N-acyltransferase